MISIIKRKSIILFDFERKSHLNKKNSAFQLSPLKQIHYVLK